MTDRIEKNIERTVKECNEISKGLTAKHEGDFQERTDAAVELGKLVDSVAVLGIHTKTCACLCVTFYHESVVPACPNCLAEFINVYDQAIKDAQDPEAPDMSKMSFNEKVAHMNKINGV